MVMALDVRLVPLLKDNYAYLLRDGASGKTAIVDPSEAAPVLRLLDELGCKLDYILNTHHHPDHSGGNVGIKEATGATVVGPQADRERIPAIDVALADGEHFRLGEADSEVMDIPGHTRGHIAFWFGGDNAVFCGDTLFALGCGRTFEGTAEQMWTSLKRLRALPPATRIYCGHEYTQANARFALTVEPANPALKARAAEIDRLRAAGQPTIPSTIAEERATNPFLRADQPEVATGIGLAGRDPVAVFAETRLRKDSF
jgi:hydroxyacylglutathione hydrolase